MENNIVKIRPKFWGDGVWFNAILIVIFQAGFTEFFYALMHDWIKAISFNIFFGLFYQPIFILLFLDQAFNSVVFTDEEVIFKGFLHKTRIPYKEITNIISSPSYWATIQYRKNAQSRLKFKQIFFWQISSKKVIDELKRRTGREIDYPNKIARANQYARIWFAAIMFLTIIVLSILMSGSLF